MNESITLKNKYRDQKKNEKFNFEFIDDIERFMEVILADFPEYFKDWKIEEES